MLCTARTSTCAIVQTSRHSLLHSRPVSFTTYGARLIHDVETGGLRGTHLASYQFRSVHDRRQSRCTYGFEDGLSSRGRLRNPRSISSFSDAITSSCGGGCGAKFSYMGSRRKTRSGSRPLFNSERDYMTLTENLTVSAVDAAGSISAGRTHTASAQDSKEPFSGNTRRRRQRGSTDRRVSGVVNSIRDGATGESVTNCVGGDDSSSSSSNSEKTQRIDSGYSQSNRSGSSGSTTNGDPSPPSTQQVEEQEKRTHSRKRRLRAASRLMPPVPAGHELLGRWQATLPNSKAGRGGPLIENGVFRGVGGDGMTTRGANDSTSSSRTVHSSSYPSYTRTNTSSSSSISSSSTANASSRSLFLYLPWPGGQMIIEGDEEAEAAADAAVEAELLERRRRRQQTKRVYGPRSEEERRRISEGLRAVERRTGRLSRTARERFEDPERKERLRAAMMKGYYEKNAPSKISARAKRRCADPAFRQLISQVKTGVAFHCKACGQAGHRRNFCPSLGHVKQDRTKRGLRRPMQCTKCGELGHNRRSCKILPEDSTKSQQLTPALRATEEVKAGKVLHRLIRCSKCGSTGHNRRTCELLIKLSKEQI